MPRPVWRLIYSKAGANCQLKSVGGCHINSAELAQNPRNSTCVLGIEPSRIYPERNPPVTHCFYVFSHEFFVRVTSRPIFSRNLPATPSAAATGTLRCCGIPATQTQGSCTCTWRKRPCNCTFCRCTQTFRLQWSSHPMLAPDN